MNEQKRRAQPTIDEVYELVKENNRMIKKMRRDAFVGGILKIVWWILILFVIPLVLFNLYLAPYLESIQSAYQNFNDNASTFNETAQGFSDLQNRFPNLEGILDQFGGGN